ncbi:MAG: hypothetical protein JWP37_1839 [Mucilaginibacter sp.]|nr:hypothetical protein [Mucilaginibacter sp.]
MKSIFSKAVITAVIAAFFTLNLQAATFPYSDTTKMDKMKMDKKMDKKMKMKKKDKMAKDTSSKM